MREQTQRSPKSGVLGCFCVCSRLEVVAHVGEPHPPVDGQHTFGA
jgi:hypothetical protein